MWLLLLLQGGAVILPLLCTSAEFLQNKKSFAYFFRTTADAAMTLQLLVLLRKQKFLFFCNTEQLGDEFNQSELRLLSTNGCGTVERHGLLRKKLHKPLWRCRILW